VSRSPWTRFLGDLSENPTEILHPELDADIVSMSQVSSEQRSGDRGKMSTNKRKVAFHREEVLANCLR